MIFNHLNGVVFEELVMFIDTSELSKCVSTETFFLVQGLRIHKTSQTPEEHLKPNLELSIHKVFEELELGLQKN